MKKIIAIIVGAFLVVSVVIGGMWIGAYNGAVKRQNTVVEYQGNVHAALSNRYEKIGVFIDAIEGANATVLAYLETITDARSDFAAAIEAGNASLADSEAETVDGTFVTLVSYMEDNPDSYNTVGLYSGFMSEFSASTNAVTFAINEYNESVTNYNNHIDTFPNLIFLGSWEAKTPYSLDNYSQPLPTFN